MMLRDVLEMLATGLQQDDEITFDSEVHRAVLIMVCEPRNLVIIPGVPFEANQYESEEQLSYKARTAIHQFLIETAKVLGEDL